VEKAADTFMARLQSAEADPAIISIRNELRAIQEEEVERALSGLRLTGIQEECVRRMARRIVNRILHSPMTGLKEEITHHDPRTVLHLARRLFGLKD
jgi:glutamyl-tRNA reductase